MKRALVTGAAGFAGQWLCRELLSGGWEVVGTMLGDVVPDGTLDLQERRAIRWISADTRQRETLTRALDEATPDAVFHLAGIAFLPDAASDPGAAIDVNVGGAARLLGDIRTRVRAGTLDPVVLVIGSAEQYGAHDPTSMPLAESAEQRPLTVYAASKAAQEVIALEAHRGDRVRVIAVRSFNHSGRGQDPRFLLPALARRALDLRGAWSREMPIGNTSPVRDYLHVEDVARAYVALAERGEAGVVYNVASGVGVDVGTVAARVLALAGVDAKLQPDEALLRPVDVPALVGDGGRLRATTGWAPTHDLDSIINDVIRAATH